MNVSGKSLQDIYDAGARRLEELQKSQNSTLDGATQGHLDACVEAEPKSLNQLENKAEDLEAEVRSHLALGLERVEKCVNAESQQNERYINRVVESLVLLSRKFSESIGQLKAAAESDLNDSCLDHESLLDAHNRSIRSSLAESASTALDSCRDSGGEAQISMATLVNDNWSALLEVEADASEGISSQSDDDLGEVEELFQATKSNLHVGLGEKLIQVEDRFSTASSLISDKVTQLVDQSERHAFSADVKLKEKFSALLFEMSTRFDELAASATADLSGLHQTAMSDLSKNSRDMSREMDNFAESVSAAAAKRTAELQTSGAAMVANYTSDLAERLEANNLFHTEIKSERETLVSEIRDELTEVRSAFEEKLASLAASTLDTMRTICGEAESAINSAQRTCASECKSQAAARQQEIESTAQKFLQKIAGTKGAALEAINKAAGAVEQDSDPAADKKTKALSKSRSGNGDDGNGDLAADGLDESAGKEGSSGDAGEIIKGESGAAKDPAQLLAEMDDGAAPLQPRPGDTVIGVESRKRKKDRKNAEKRSSGDKK